MVFERGQPRRGLGVQEALADPSHAQACAIDAVRCGGIGDLVVGTENEG